MALRAEFEISCVRRHALAVEMGRVDHRVQRRVQWMLRKNHKTSEAAGQGAYLPIRLRKCIAHFTLRLSHQALPVGSRAPRNRCCCPPYRIYAALKDSAH